MISASISPSFDILRNIQNDPRPTTVSHVHVHPPAGGASTSRGLQKSPGNVLVFSVLFSNGKFSGRGGRRQDLCHEGQEAQVGEEQGWQKGLLLPG